MTEKMSSPIKYGMFIMPYHHPTKPLSQGYEEDIELVVRAEELGERLSKSNKGLVVLLKSLPQTTLCALWVAAVTRRPSPSRGGEV